MKFQLDIYAQVDNDDEQIELIGGWTYETDTPNTEKKIAWLRSIMKQLEDTIREHDEEEDDAILYPKH